MTDDDREQLAAYGLRIARRKARQTHQRRPSLDKDDLESAGAMAAAMAIDDYDPDRGTTIRQHVAANVDMAVKAAARAGTPRGVANGRARSVVAVKFSADPVTGQTLLPADRSLHEPAALLAAAEGLPDPGVIAAAAAKQRAAWVAAFSVDDIREAADALKKRAVTGNLQAIKLMHQMTGGAM